MVFLRIAVGVFFLIFGEYKVFGTQFTLHGGFQFWINKFLTEGGAYPFMVPILKGFVLPNATTIAFLVAYGEFSIGLALTLGILVRPASLGGLIFMLTLLVFLRLSWLGRPLLAVLRRQPRTLRFRALLHRVHDRPLRYSLVHQSLASDASTVGKPTGVSRLSSGLPFPNLIKSWRH